MAGSDGARSDTVTLDRFPQISIIADITKGENIVMSKY